MTHEDELIPDSELGTFSTRLPLDNEGRNLDIAVLVVLWLYSVIFFLFFYDKTNLFRNLLTTSFVFYCLIWIMKKIKQYRRKFYLMLYENGIEYRMPNSMISAYYNEIKVWQKIRTVTTSIYFIPVSKNTDYLYTLKFANGKLVKTKNKDTGEQLQNTLTTYLLPSILALYDSGDTIYFDKIRLNNQEIIIKNIFWETIIVWSNIDHFKVANGEIYIKTIDSVWAATRVSISKIPNVYVLLGLLKYLNYLEL